MMADENIIDDSGVPELELPQSGGAEVSTPELIHAPLGEVLLEARNAKKLTQKDVSNNLRISIKQITALETDDFALLPDAMITRGFIRNYARLLEIDAEPLLASYRAQMPDKAPAKLSVHSSMNTVMSGKDSQPWLIYILSSILVLLFLLAWLFYVDYMPKPSVDKLPQSVALPVTAPTAEVALPEIALPAAERVVDEGVVANSEFTENSQASATDVTQAGKSTADAVNPVIANSVSPLNTAQPNSLTQKQPLPAEKKLAQVTPEAGPSVSSPSLKKVNVSVDEQTWVRVTDQSGAVIYEKLLEAGNSDGFDGEPPFNVQVGNAKATKVTFLGKQIDLTSYTKNNVARFVLQ